MAGIIGTLVTGALAVYFYLNPRTRGRLAYQMMSVRYFDEEELSLPEGAKMTFKGDDVDRLTKTLVVLWNIGQDTLSRGDIVQENPLRVCFPEDDRILHEEIVKLTDDTIKADVQARSGAAHELLLSYDYLNANDGFVLKVIHDGRSPYPQVLGRSQRVPNGPENLGTFESASEVSSTRAVFVRRYRYIAVGVGLLGILLGLVLLVTGVVMELAPSGQMLDVLDIAQGVIMIVYGVIILMAPAVYYWFKRRRFPKSLSM